MKISVRLFTLAMMVFAFFGCNGNKSGQEVATPETTAPKEEVVQKEQIVVGAARMNEYLPLLEGKRVAMVVNHTAVIGSTHIVDTLLSRGVNIVKVFAPEHGFRGEADAGQKIDDGKDAKTGVTITSLYGKTRKPTAQMLEDVDVIIFDIQDVGVRFYTYISTMHHTMDGAAEHNKEYIVLDRPNPNGNYVDGPIREEGLESFVGIHPIPIVHGLTVGELAEMINGEGWLANGAQCNLKVIRTLNYTHADEWSLPIKPSPNLPNDVSIALYPSICFFEGTTLSLGRGTYKPFQQVGDPSLKGQYEYTFTPISIPGMATKPKHMDEVCYGMDYSTLEIKREFTLKYLIEFYNAFENKNDFFNGYIDKLAGTTQLKEQIKQGMSEEDIRKTWEPALSDYKEIRKKYLLYPEQ